MSVGEKVLRLYRLMMDILHHRWWKVHPAYFLVNRKPMFLLFFHHLSFEGDSFLPSKADPLWKLVWPRVVLRPCTPGPNGVPYHGWYWLFYISDDDSRCKMLPVCGLVAPRIGDGPVDFRAVTLTGKPLELFVETLDDNVLSARQV